MAQATAAAARPLKILDLIQEEVQIHEDALQTIATGIQEVNADAVSILAVMGKYGQGFL